MALLTMAWRGLLSAALLLAPCLCGPMDCYMPEDNGLSYRGLVDSSMSGRPCIKWTKQSAIAPTVRNGIGNHGYCRNPDESADSPWCLVHGTGVNEMRKEPCHVDVCEDESRDFEGEAEALEIYMGSHDCNCGSGLLQQGRWARTRGALRGPLLPDSAPPATKNASGLSAARLKQFLQACRLEAGQRPTVANGTMQLRLAMLWRESRRRCGLSEVLARHCHCTPHADPKAAGGLEGSAAVAAAAAPVALSDAAAQPHFHADCSTACYSVSCSSCTSCTAICQSGPYAYCKSEAAADEQQWWGMCGATSHRQLTQGYKQCFDQPPTGCPN